MKKVLIVVDMQKDFVDGALGTNEALHIVDKVVQKIQEFDGDIYVTYDTHGEDYMETREGKYLPVLYTKEAEKQRGSQNHTHCSPAVEGMKKAHYTILVFKGASFNDGADKNLDETTAYSIKNYSY